MTKTLALIITVKSMGILSICVYTKLSTTKPRLQPPSHMFSLVYSYCLARPSTIFNLQVPLGSNLLNNQTHSDSLRHIQHNRHLPRLTEAIKREASSSTPLPTPPTLTEGCSMQLSHPLSSRSAQIFPHAFKLLRIASFTLALKVATNFRSTISEW